MRVQHYAHVHTAFSIAPRHSSSDQSRYTFRPPTRAREGCGITHRIASHTGYLPGAIQANILQARTSRTRLKSANGSNTHKIGTTKKQVYTTLSLPRLPIRNLRLLPGFLLLRIYCSGQALCSRLTHRPNRGYNLFQTCPFGDFCRF